MQPFLFRKGASLFFERMDSYIGVMVGDLTSNKRDEPYRFFTARSENSFIREDNVINRIGLMKALGLNKALIGIKKAI